MRLKWGDNRLKWNPKEFSNITEIVVNSKKIWIPDIMLTTFSQVTDTSNYGNNLNLRIRYDGTV